MTTLEVLKRECIIPTTISELFYCVFADHAQKRCSRECKGFYAARDLVKHLRTTHQKTTKEIAELLTPKRLDAARVPKTYVNVARRLYAKFSFSEPQPYQRPSAVEGDKNDA